MKKTRITATVLAAVMLAGLSACAPEQSGSAGGSSEESKIRVTVNETVYPFTQNYLDYLRAEGDVKVGTYRKGNTEPYAPVTVKWVNEYENTRSVTFEYSADRDFASSVTVDLPAGKSEYELYNLYKSTEYYVRVTAILDNDERKSAEGSFKTADIGVRAMKIDGIYNVRDAGGYRTTDGKVTAQGRMFRGGALSKCYDHAYDFVSLTEEGKAYMRDTLGIRTDFDLRNEAQNEGLTESPIPGAKLEYYNLDGYLSAFTQPEPYRKAIAGLADENRYPVYIHCTGGADRTGTLVFLINALLGVGEDDLIRDYETTTFSVYGERSRNSGIYKFSEFYAQLKTYAGSTLAEKTENYMLSIGVTKTQIESLRSIMLTEV